MTVTPDERDVDLIGRARRGDPKALEVLYTEHAPAVMRLAHRVTGSAADAEDVLQDVFLGLPEALRRYDEQGSFAGWLLRITTRVALMRMRTARRRREVPIDAVPEPERPMPADALADAAALEQAIARLSTTLRVTFVLKAAEGYSHAEIAEILGITTSTSEVRYHRALKKVRDYLRRFS